MNHTTIASVVAISMVAAIALAGISILSSAKVMAVAEPPRSSIIPDLGTGSLSFGGFTVNTDDLSKVQITGPNGFNVNRDIPQIPSGLLDLGQSGTQASPSTSSP
jgi:hypothetical protein